MVSVRKGLVLAAVCLLGLGLGAQQAAPPATVTDFDVEGIGFTECQCTAYACPCRANAHPEHGSCQAADFAHIKRGQINGVTMDGFKAVIVGNLLDKHAENKFATAYFDVSTTPQQREAYVTMLKFMFGPGWPVKVGEPKEAPIAFSESADKTVYTVSIPGILEMKGVLKRDKDGKPVKTVPAMDQWGNAINYLDNVVFKYNDAGVSWDLSGRQGNVKYFHATKKMYDNKELLALHGDQSGFWNEKQKEMIKKLGMKVE